jgi:hypothetical protein
MAAAVEMATSRTRSAAVNINFLERDPRSAVCHVRFGSEADIDQLIQSHVGAGREQA